MKKLIHIVRGYPERGTRINLITPGGEVARQEIEAIIPRKVDVNVSNFQTEGEFFLVHEQALEETITLLAQANPGREVRVYNIESISVCPAAEMVRKKISEHGVLPDFGV